MAARCSPSHSRSSITRRCRCRRISACVGHDGTTYYSKYGLALPLLSVLPVLLAQPIGALTGRTDLIEAATASSLMPLIAGALAAALYLLGRRLTAPRRAAALVAVGIVLGTYLLPYGRDFFTEPLVALGLVVMVERALAGREQQAGAALAFAVLARPQSAAFAPLLLGFVLLRGGGLRAVLRTIPPLAAVAVVTVAYNLYRFHDALQFGYEPPVDPGFTTPLLRGTRGLLLDPEKSIVLFAPASSLRRSRCWRCGAASGWWRGCSWRFRRDVRARGDVAFVAGRMELGAAARHSGGRIAARRAGPWIGDQPVAATARRGAVRRGLRDLVLRGARAAGSAAHRSRGPARSARRSCASTASCHCSSIIRSTPPMIAAHVTATIASTFRHGRRTSSARWAATPRCRP